MTRFSTKEVLDIVTADNDFGLSDSDNSEEGGEGRLCLPWRKQI